MSDASKELPHDEPAQIVVTGEAGSGKWNPAFGTWEADDFGMDSAEPVGLGERLFVNRKLYDALQAKVARLEAVLKAIKEEEGSKVNHLARRIGLIGMIARKALEHVK